MFRTLIIISLALMLSACSGSSLTDYVIGDGKPKPVRRSAPVQSAANTDLRAGQNLSSYSYDGGSSVSARSGSVKLGPAPKSSQRVYVTVNDTPITGYDISQRARLNSLLGYSRGSGKAARKQAMRELIDDVIRMKEAKKNNVDISDKRILDTIGGMAKASGSNLEGFKSRLRKSGVAFSSLKKQVKANLASRWLLQSKGQSNIKVDDAAVDRKLRKINSDPRRQGVTVYMLRQVDLPVEQTSPAMAQQLTMARAAEAQQIAAKYRGCRSLKKAARGFYNVKVGRRIEADSRKLPKQMRKALRAAGTRKLIGPMRTRQGIQMIAFCGTRRIQPPKVSRAQVKNSLLNAKFSQASERVMRDLRRQAFIDYKDNSLR